MRCCRGRLRGGAGGAFKSGRRAPSRALPSRAGPRRAERGPMRLPGMSQPFLLSPIAECSPGPPGAELRLAVLGARGVGKSGECGPPVPPSALLPPYPSVLTRPLCFSADRAVPDQALHRGLRAQHGQPVLSPGAAGRGAGGRAHPGHAGLPPGMGGSGPDTRGSGRGGGRKSLGWDHRSSQWSSPLARLCISGLLHCTGSRSHVLGRFSSQPFILLPTEPHSAQGMPRAVLCRTPIRSLPLESSAYEPLFPKKETAGPSPPGRSSTPLAGLCAGLGAPSPVPSPGRVPLQVQEDCVQALDALSRCMKWAEGFLVVYSITDPGSYQAVRPLHQHIRQLHPDARIPIVVVGNKADLLHARQVQAKEGLQLANELGSLFLEISTSESSQGVCEVFQYLCREVSKLQHAERRRPAIIPRPRSPNMQDLKRRFKQALSPRVK